MPGAAEQRAEPAPFTVLRGGNVLLPSGPERTDVLVAGGRVAALGTSLDHSIGSHVTVHELDGLTLAPGLIDAHVHFLGGGGGDGFDTRAPELALTDLTANGITTVVGAPGIDMVSRSMEGLLAKARGLREEGLTAFVYVGGFQRPLRTLTGAPWRDVYLLPDVIGVKLAVGESRAPAISVGELVHLARELAWVERAAGRAAVMHIHLGVEPDGAETLLEALPRFPNPARVVITHCNYTPQNLAAARRLAPLGVRLDMTTMFSPQRGVAGAVRASDAVATLLDANVPADQISMSTDGNGSVPRDVGGSWGPYQTNMDSLLDEVRALAQGRSLALALATVTVNPASALKLSRKGVVAEGADADFVALGENLDLMEVYAGGRRLVHQGRVVVRGRFENKQLAGDEPERKEVRPPQP
jgi:beta-aspartyl-dipeptidase (metallo-type)